MLIILIMGMGLLSGMVALVIDIGLFMHERRELQNAADAAAIAGGAELCESLPYATAIATEWAENNGIDAGAGELTKVQAFNTGSSDVLEVGVGRDVRFYFARMLGMNTARASAQAKSAAFCRGHLRPWGLAEAAIAGLAPGAELTLQQWGGPAVPGNYYALSIDGPGVNVYRETIKYSSRLPLCAEESLLLPLLQGDEGYEPPSPDCPSKVFVEPGMTAKHTSEGMQWLIANTISECDEFTEAFEIVVPDELPSTEVVQVRPECDPYPPYNVEGSRRVITVPIVKQVTAVGRQQVDVIGFAVLWLEDLNCPPGPAGRCDVAVVLVDLMARVPWYRWARLVE